MKILISGASGMIGRAVSQHFRSQGCEVICLARRFGTGSHSVRWNPAKGELDASVLEGVKVVINLAGENISEGRWTAKRKRELRQSRIDSTRTLVHAILHASQKPELFISASATGIYGDRGDEELTEKSTEGSGFLAGLCHDWEQEACQAEKHGVRVVLLRPGIVLSANGGALVKMLPMFRLGLGGRVGSGRQFWSWITLEDLVRVIEFAIQARELSGRVNATSPEPVTNAVFTRELAAQLHRPAWIPVPAFAARFALGEMADEALLASTRVMPRKLLSAGFKFHHPGLAEGLRASLR